MEEEKNLNQDTEKIDVQQVFQNYLIEPDFLTTNFEKSVVSLGEVNLPQIKITEEYNNNFQKINEENDNLKTIGKFNFFDNSITNLSKYNTPINVLEKPKNPPLVTKKELDSVIKQLSGNINPAIENLYKSVSAVMDKGKDPKSYTEQRPTYNGDLYFFGDEVSKLSKKFLWS